jgi:hypothetical protein
MIFIFFSNTINMEWVDMYTNVCDIMRTENAKTSFLGDLDYYRWVKGSCFYISGVLDEPILSSMAGIGMQMNHFMFEHVAKVTDRLLEAGILKNWYDWHNKMLYGMWKIDFENGPKVLTVESLSFGFVMWLGACGVSFAAFVGENLWFFVSFQVQKQVRSHLRKELKLIVRSLLECFV